jgi:hypothetical protein
MVACSSVRNLTFVLSVVTCSMAQSALHPPGPATSAPPVKLSLVVASTVQVPTLPAESITEPIFCDLGGSIVFRLAMPDTGVGDPISVSRDGKTVISFTRQKINDVSRPEVMSMFPSGSGVYILTRGTVLIGGETKWRTPTGEVQIHPATKSSTFVARFERDGTYGGAVLLDLPFKPLHLGVFENGDFLIAGAEPSTDEPRVAIVGPNGQLRRFVELKGDVHAQTDSDIAARDKDPTALPRSKPWRGAFAESLRDVVSNSQIVKDGPNLLLFRPMNGPVYSISAGGEVQVHKLKMEGDYRLFTIRADRNSWIVELIHEVPHGGGDEFATYAFDRESGSPLREYFFPTDLGWGLACADGDEFTFVMADDVGTSLKLVKLTPAGSPEQ